MTAAVGWIRANASWLQSLLQVGMIVSVDFGLNLTEQQRADILIFSAIALGLGGHFTSKGQNT